MATGNDLLTAPVAEYSGLSRQQIMVLTDFGNTGDEWACDIREVITHVPVPRLQGIANEVRDFLAGNRPTPGHVNWTRNHLHTALQHIERRLKDVDRF